MFRQTQKPMAASSTTQENWVDWESNIVITQSQTLPVFGSQFQIDLRETNIIIHDMYLQFSVNAITGLTGSVTSYPNLVPAQFWVDHYEVLCNGNQIDVRYPIEQFAITNLFQKDEGRKIENTSQGDYSSVAIRNAKNNDGELWMIPMRNVLTTAHYELLSQNHFISLKVFLKPVTSIVNQSTLTGTPSVLINGCNLITRVSRLDGPAVQRRLLSLAQRPKTYKMHILQQMAPTFSSGSLTFQQTLSAINGKVAALLIVVCKNTELLGDLAFASQKIASFEILDGSGKNVMGGSVQTHLLNKAMLKYWSDSTYSTEANANVYVWSFSSNLERAIMTGQSYGSRVFNATEQLKITALESSSNKTVYVYALVENMLSQNLITVTKA